MNRHKAAASTPRAVVEQQRHPDRDVRGALFRRNAPMSGVKPPALANEREQLQNACMPAITIRDVPNETRDQLAERAAASGRSLQQYLRAELIRLAGRPDNLAIVTRAQARVRETGEGLTGDQILELLDAGRAERE